MTVSLMSTNCMQGCWKRASNAYIDILFLANYERRYNVTPDLQLQSLTFHMLCAVNACVFTGTVRMFENRKDMELVRVVY